jgi:hypothetical protein
MELVHSRVLKLQFGNFRINDFALLDLKYLHKILEGQNQRSNPDSSYKPVPFCIFCLNSDEVKITKFSIL